MEFVQGKISIRPRFSPKDALMYTSVGNSVVDMEIRKTTDVYESQV